jgi:protein-disulfide isomerase
MSFRAKVVDGAIVVIAFCALSVTALAARNSGLFGGSPPGGSPPSGARQVPQLASIAKEANWIGPRDAKVVITEFADFECPACQRIKSTIDSIRQSAPDKIALAFVHFPLSRIHPHAYRAALIAECGAQQENFCVALRGNVWVKSADFEGRSPAF